MSDRFYDFVILQIDPGQNAETWWDNGGRELWKEAQTRAGNINTWQTETAVAFPYSDPFRIYNRFAAVPGWDDGRPMIYTGLAGNATNWKEYVRRRMRGLGVTEANLRALDLIEE